MKAKKIRIHPSVLLFTAFFYTDGKLALFLWLILFVTMHEFSHITTALAFGCKFQSISLSPLGERAVIKNIERLGFIKRLAVYAAGPLSNFIAVFFIFLLFGNSFLIKINLFIGLFNLMPVMPLDGGMIAFHALGRKIGVLNSARIIISLSKAAGYIILACGLVQTVLFPFNLSLLLIGMFIIHSQRHAYSGIFLRFLEGVASRKVPGNQIVPVKMFASGKTTPLCKIIRIFSYDSFCFICVKHKGGLSYISQDEIIRHYYDGRALATLEEVLNS